MTWIIVSEYEKGDRKSTIYETSEGYAVEVFDKGILKKVHNLYEHTLRYAEDCAENWIEGVTK